jgi:hypothetical protein
MRLGRGWEHLDAYGMDTLRKEVETDDTAILGRCCFPLEQLERGSSAPVSHANRKRPMD